MCVIFLISCLCWSITHWYQQGTLDIAVQRTGAQKRGTVTFIQNNFYYDAFFLNAIGMYDPVFGTLLALMVGTSVEWCVRQWLLHFAERFKLFGECRTLHRRVGSQRQTAIWRELFRGVVQVHCSRHLWSTVSCSR